MNKSDNCFLGESINLLVNEMSERGEKQPAQFPKAQGDLISSLVLFDQLFQRTKTTYAENYQILAPDAWKLGKRINRLSQYLASISLSVN